eukprot:TRINITY_DN12611_c0_g1_i1.p2 TRINITY_DN12611_c0_g1~~TRINITY_DN12611_c0_g1_i1.p2  ORF type:complete len:512 (-),score=98.03 TRINITY_DN12611_c0_g1_i1:1078-2613(-)
MQSLPPIVTAKAWVAIDATDGTMLWSKQEHMQVQVASLTKIMTAYLVLQLANESPEILEEETTVSEMAAVTKGTTASLRTGDVVRVSDLLYGLMLPSGNDAAVALAEHFGARLQSRYRPSSSYGTTSSSPSRSPAKSPLTRLKSAPHMPSPSRRAIAFDDKENALFSQCLGVAPDYSAFACAASAHDYTSVASPAPRSPSKSHHATPYLGSLTTHHQSPQSPQFSPAHMFTAEERVAMFVRAMNRQATKFGMNNTRYMNPHGLMQKGFWSCARDIATLSWIAMQDERFRDIVRTKHRTIYMYNSVRNKQRRIVWENTNKLLSIDGYDGLKTGVTNAAGYCLASSCSRSGHRVIIVTLGSDTLDDRWADTLKLFSYTWRQLGQQARVRRAASRQGMRDHSLLLQDVKFMRNFEHNISVAREDARRPLKQAMSDESIVSERSMVDRSVVERPLERPVSRLREPVKLRAVGGPLSAAPMAVVERMPPALGALPMRKLTKHAALRDHTIRAYGQA